MCKLGDIIVVKEFKNEFGEKMKKHSFVVISDDKDSIEGFNYEFICNMLCSFHDEKHKERKLKYKENLAIRSSSIKGDSINSKEGFIKADQLYYFKKRKIKYKVIAKMNEEALNQLLRLIITLNDEGKIRIVISNLT